MVTFTNFDGSPAELLLEENFFSEGATITFNKEVAARVKREYFNSTQISVARKTVSSFAT